jgi:hypothetical protein
VARLSYPGCSILLTLRVYFALPCRDTCDRLIQEPLLRLFCVDMQNVKRLVKLIHHFHAPAPSRLQLAVETLQRLPRHDGGNGWNRFRGIGVYLFPMPR